MLLFYVRHGDPIYNPDSLTELGHKQAQALVARMKVCNPSKIFVSSSNRARQTAQPTADALGIEPIILDWANEKYAYADLSVSKPEGKRGWMGEDKELMPFLVSEELRALDREWHTHPILRERGVVGTARIAKETDAWLESLGYKREGNGYRVLQENHDRVALFAHWGFGLGFLSHILDIPYPQMVIRFCLGHSQVTVINFGGNEFSIPQVLQLSNDSHLFAAGIDTKYVNRLLF